MFLWQLYLFSAKEVYKLDDKLPYICTLTTCFTWLEGCNKNMCLNDLIA